MTEMLREGFGLVQTLLPEGMTDFITPAAGLFAVLCVPKTYACTASKCRNWSDLQVSASHSCGPVVLVCPLASKIP
jgi:hypothetical protein